MHSALLVVLVPKLVRGVALVVLSGAAVAAAAPVAPREAPTDAAPACPSFTSEYALAARLRLEDTPFGAGDGTYDIGPGRLRLRFIASPNGGPSRVELLGYEMRERFVIESSVLFLRAKVTTRTDTRATPDERGVAAMGALSGGGIDWSSPVRGYRTDGTLTCEGSGCGFPGAPSSGTTPLHIGPGPVAFSRFVFDSPDFDTFHMDFTRVSQTSTPKQTAFVTLAGRKMTRECNAPAAAR